MAQAAGALPFSEAALLEAGGKTIDPPNDRRRYQAETGVLHNVGIEYNNFGYSRGGYLAGWSTPGQSVDFQVTVPDTRTYQLHFRYSGGDGKATRLLYVDGTTLVEQLPFNDTGGWRTYADIGETPVALNAGRNTMLVIFNSSPGSAHYLNLDPLELR